ncbi:MAG TPA: DUF2520 domain-containing protein [Pyrinomonadaceae bacterium]|jgi:predicted short-subunit dehydrogenase-like oxidoreductase (DUF2520 family)
MPRQTRPAKKIDDTPARPPRAARTTRPPAGKTRRKEKRPAPVKEKRAAAPPTVVIVGAGRLGTALAVALERRGYRVAALVSRRRSHARRAARLLRSPPPALGASELEKIPDSDILIIATPDDQIAATAARLAASPRAPAPRPRVALHASGALSSDALRPLRARGFSTGSLHPLVSVSDPESNARDFGGAYYCVEGEAAAARAARRIVRALGGRSFSVASRDKALYHAAAVFAAGHAVALFDLATDLLAQSGVGAKLARRVALHLARGTLSNLARARANADALTGPFSRADAATVRAHAGAISSRPASGDALAAYAALGRRSLLLAARGGALAPAAEEIRDYLDGLGRRKR